MIRLTILHLRYGMCLVRMAQLSVFVRDLDPAKQKKIKQLSNGSIKSFETKGLKIALYNFLSVVDRRTLLHGLQTDLRCSYHRKHVLAHLIRF